MTATTDESDQRLARLLAVPLPTFVAERQRLIDALKAQGKPSEAKAIAKVVKPSVPVWVVNQLARQDGPLVRRLGALTADLRWTPLASHEARAGKAHGESSDYAQTIGAHRDTLKALRAGAERILTAAGLGSNPHTLERVVHNLRAGAAIDETRAAIEGGRLMREVAEQDFASLLNPLGAGDGDAPAREPRPPVAGRSPAGGRVSAGAGAPVEPRDPPARGDRPHDRDGGTARARESNRKQAAHAQRLAAREEAARARVRAREQRAKARELTRARAAAERTRAQLQTQVAAAKKTLIQEERALASARQTLADRERRADLARRKAEAMGRALEEAEAEARALASAPAPGRDP